MRKYLTILFSFALISAMLLPSVLSMVSDELIVNCDFSEEEEKKEHKESELEKEKILNKTASNTFEDFLYCNGIATIEIVVNYKMALPDIQLPPPERAI